MQLTLKKFMVGVILAIATVVAHVTPVFTGAAQAATANGTEYYIPSIGRYFWTADATEVAALAAYPAVYTKTGRLGNLVVQTTAQTWYTPFYRWDVTLPNGTHSHFYTASEADKNAIQALNKPIEYKFEGVKGYVLALVNGACPSWGYPVYRYFNAGSINHRYVVDGDVVTAMNADKAWKNEGIAFCTTGTPATSGTVAGAAPTGSLAIYGDRVEVVFEKDADGSLKNVGFASSALKVLPANVDEVYYLSYRTSWDKSDAKVKGNLNIRADGTPVATLNGREINNDCGTVALRIRGQSELAWLSTGTTQTGKTDTQTTVVWEGKGTDGKQYSVPLYNAYGSKPDRKASGCIGTGKNGFQPSEFVLSANGHKISYVAQTGSIVKGFTSTIKDVSNLEFMLGSDVTGWPQGGSGIYCAATYDGDTDGIVITCDAGRSLEGAKGNIFARKRNDFAFATANWMSSGLWDSPRPNIAYSGDAVQVKTGTNEYSLKFERRSD